jgi:BioD-like phosphotransacetylase family protein
LTVLYVASDKRGAGKTAFCVTLARDLGLKGQRAAVVKPLGHPDDPDDGIYQQLLGQPAGEAARPLPAGALSPELLEEIKAKADTARDGKDVLIVEGASEMTAADSRQVADALDAKVVVVARFEPGLDVKQLSHWRSVFGDRLVGCVINGLTPYRVMEMSSKLLPSLEAEGLVCLGVVPDDRTLVGVSVRQLASHLEGRFLVGGDIADGLVEHFLVGGLGIDSGLEYFGLRDNKAVIVRGDRPDIQMAALQTPTTCMLSTGGVEPIEYVVNEAELEEVPIVVVDADTIGTMDSIATLQEGARFDHPAKLERYAALLDQHVDITAVRAALGLAA